MNNDKSDFAKISSAAIKRKKIQRFLINIIHDDNSLSIFLRLT